MEELAGAVRDIRSKIDGQSRHEEALEFLHYEENKEREPPEYKDLESILTVSSLKSSVKALTKRGSLTLG
eukprot:CAMPEP_0206260780 /NCGR_PEP_ID=MMETSP0047_2-20121206/27285_1 /ASSEMBLY_ACC=CAM_ASM_000192 /TAXON_ID=195065 /ORGANISM="Chroomonas mesostigmatica_cf, Strain CCMP1168" /LENGTH=69 /DNA_ID=CAMNT_0053687913 /DNA_START=1 /DNA_END=207 /DNA_ORIENTATION=-